MVAVAVGPRLYAKVSDLDDLPPTLIDEIEQLFINYNKMRGPVIQAYREERRGRGFEVGEAQHCKSRKEKALEVARLVERRFQTRIYISCYNHVSPIVAIGLTAARPRSTTVTLATQLRQRQLIPKRCPKRG